MSYQFNFINEGIGKSVFLPRHEKKLRILRWLNRFFCVTDFRAQLLGPTNFPLHLATDCNFDLDVHFISQLDSDEEISEEMSNDNVGRKPNTLEMTPSELQGLSGNV